jgi:pSer/pThr/pTyr-binding forkhead associated (FHA) protein
MRIEILVDNEEPRIYPLDRPKIIVGNHESCDIVIQHKGISRKHLVLTVKDDKYYVADQGSTNGSYINEHRLVPGSSAEFTSFFPVRLGDDVLMTLLSDEEAEDLGPESSFNTKIEVPQERDESTRVISLKDLNKSSTSGLVQKRTETVTRRKAVKQAPPPKKKTAASNSTMGIIAIILIAGAAYFQLVLNKNEDVKVETTTEQKPVAKAPVEDNRPVLRIEESELPSAEKILAAAKDPKCTTDIEKYLCVTLPLIYQEKWGTVQIDNSTVMIADGAKYAQMAREYVRASPPTVEEGGSRAAVIAYQADLGLMMTVLWMRDHIPLEVEKLDGFEKRSITLAFVDLSKKEETSFVSAAGFVPESLLRLRRKIQDKHFVNAKETGAAEFSYALEYLRLL